MPPSLSYLTKYWPKIDSWTYFGSTDTGSTTAVTAATTSTNTVESTHTNNSSTTPPTVETTTTVGAIDTLKQINNIISTVQIIKNNNGVKQVAKILGEEKGYLVVKIEQRYEHYVHIMIDKYLLMGWGVKGNMLVIDSFNGAVYLSTNMKDSGIVSYTVLFYFILIILWTVSVWLLVRVI